MSDYFKNTVTTVHDPAIWTGRTYFDLVNPNPDEVHLTDIAVALSRVPRFAGFGAFPISIGHHSLNCVIYAKRIGVTNLKALQAIFLHDAHEAYCHDVSRPMKRALPDYSVIENRCSAAVRERFGISDDWGPIVQPIDDMMLSIEAAAIFPDHVRWPGLPEPEPFAILPQESSFVEWAFLDMAAALELSL